MINRLDEVIAVQLENFICLLSVLFRYPLVAKEVICSLHLRLIQAIESGNYSHLEIA